MTQKLILLVSIFIALTSQDIQRPDEYFILSQIKTEKKVGETTINPKNIYAIDM